MPELYRLPKIDPATGRLVTGSFGGCSINPLDWGDCAKDAVEWVADTAEAAWDGVSPVFDTLEEAVDYAKDKFREAADVGWTAFSTSIQNSAKSFTDFKWPDDVMTVGKTILTGGADPLAGAGIAAAQAVMAELTSEWQDKIARKIAEGYCKGYLEGGAHATGWVNDQLHDLGAPKIVRKVLAEVLKYNWDIIMGAPSCLCEYACGKPVADGLKNAGGIPGIVGNILAVMHPLMRGSKMNYQDFGGKGGGYGNYGGQIDSAIKKATDNEADSACLCLYTGRKDHSGLPLLPNVKLGKDALGTFQKVLEKAGVDLSKMTMTQAFDQYRPWIVDSVARGYRGPTGMGGKHDARYYFENPGAAAKVLKNADLASWFGEEVAKAIKMIEKGLSYVDQAIDIYEAIDSGKQISLDSFDSIQFDEGAVRGLAELAFDKGKGWAERKAVSKANDIMEKSGANKVFEAFQSVGSFRGSWSDVPRDFIVEWMPALIGMEARAKYSSMVVAWCGLSPTERAKWADMGHSVWKETYTSFPSWYSKFSGSTKIAKICFNRNLPEQYKQIATLMVEKWKGLSVDQREKMRQVVGPMGQSATYRAGATRQDALRQETFRGLSTTPGQSGEIAWSYRIPKSGHPSPADVGWPYGKGSKGESCSAQAYWSWFCDWYDIHHRFIGALAYYKSYWERLDDAQKKAWLNYRNGRTVSQDLDEAGKSPGYGPDQAFESSESTSTNQLRGLYTLGARDLEGPYTWARFWATKLIKMYPSSAPSIATFTPGSAVTTKVSEAALTGAELLIAKEIERQKSMVSQPSASDRAFSSKSQPLASDRAFAEAQKPEKTPSSTGKTLTTLLLVAAGSYMVYRLAKSGKK